jgi:hypothetical protein
MLSALMVGEAVLEEEGLEVLQAQQTLKEVKVVF